ncbi:MAG: hypothetical protein IJV85_04350 [Clostridia bacterium]|nr:hypothetical protein [Clostridia bacterium]
MTEKDIAQFKYAVKSFLSKQRIDQLRAYGRFVGVEKPTTKQKAILIDESAEILSGEKEPVSQSRRGAPIKNDFIDPKIIGEIEHLKKVCLGLDTLETEDFKIYGLEQGKPIPVCDFTAEMKRLATVGHNLLQVASPNAEEEPRDIRDCLDSVYSGQLVQLNGVSCLLPLTCIDSAEKIIISVELIREAGLREGDIVSCYAEKRSSVFIATKILTVNDVLTNSVRRTNFEEEAVCYASERLSLLSTHVSTTLKYLDWISPIGKGQRVGVVSQPKAGKTNMLLELATSLTKNAKVDLLVLLVDQTPETVGQFRKIVPSSHLVYTTYEDEPERCVFAANFLLQRAKRFVESGRDVVLLVDSLSSLARSFNETNESAGGKTYACGLESKTVHFIKKYFGSARCLENGGSLTMVGTVDCGTGNPMDDILCSEIRNISNLEIPLSDELAIRRIYPAIDLSAVRRNTESLLTDEEERLVLFLKERYLPKEGAESLQKLLEKATSYEDLISNVK